MSLDTFLYNLHFNVDKVTPPGWEVDWDDAPLPYKLYHQLPAVPLSLEVPLTLDAISVRSSVKPTHDEIGHLLWYVYGLSQVSHTPYLSEDEDTMDIMQSYRRFVPSGGARYPNEVYVYLKLEDIPTGVYHYDVAHHRLILLREGHYDNYIARALGHRCDIGACCGTVFVSTRFWKNYFKYHNFSYRLQGLDTGVLIGQLLEVAKRFDFASPVYFQFLDRAVNHLLGLSEREESVYAVIPLSEKTMDAGHHNQAERIGANEAYDLSKIEEATSLCAELPKRQHHIIERSRNVKPFPMLLKLNEAAMQETTRAFGRLQTSERMADTAYTGHTDLTVPLPQVTRASYDLATASGERYSPEMDFVLGKVSQSQLATLLQETMATFKHWNDIDTTVHRQIPTRIKLYVCLYQVEGIPDGAYYYDCTAHTLQQVHPGDHRLPLQLGMDMATVNVLQTPLCFHLVGDRDHYIPSLGYRGYRIQQMEAGMLLQKLLLAATTLGMGGHPLLGYDVKQCDELYQLQSRGQTTLIQIPVGPYRPRPWIKANLQS
ncbi:SagB/ThcOx family dehydrogenase [Caldalkalibacillus salinus]|uniref:SagB/ThcOx family dehydrogenase n=1 Tax=Caldalkalibacillus salinus TaxID=2803787 RepID=UPI001923D14B|nr:SagB family peptide dehydrogenase [Caldalkalibacillus salinus]